jgi:vacuolar-type H+-ATPase subunit I/STV1
MAHAHGLTREDVFAAADEIFASGKNPTQASVRAKLGKGSFSTISKHLSDWRETQTDTEAILNADQEISDQELSLLKRVYGMLRANVEVSVIGEQVELLERENQELRERQGSYDAIAAELAGLRYAYQEALERLDSVTRENERLTQAATKTSTRKPRTAKSATT